MGKAPIMKEQVQWISDTATKTCYGIAVASASSAKVLKELIEAPVEKSTLEYRSGKAGTYADEYLVMETQVDLSADDLAKVPYTFVEVSKSEKNSGFKLYKFIVDEASEQTT